MPTIIFLGREDKLIPVAVIERFQRGMQAAGMRCDTHFYDSAGHGFFNPSKGGSDEHFQDTLNKTDAFLISLDWLSPVETQN